MMEYVCSSTSSDGTTNIPRKNILEKDRTQGSYYNYNIMSIGDDLIKTRDVTVWTMLIVIIVNLICFVIITACYIAIISILESLLRNQGT